VIHDGIGGLMGAPQRGSVAPAVIAAIAGILLLVGLWTPISGGPHWLALAIPRSEWSQSSHLGFAVQYPARFPVLILQKAGRWLLFSQSVAVERCLTEVLQNFC
jgi:hypothetical protein